MQQCDNTTKDSNCSQLYDNDIKFYNSIGINPTDTRYNCSL